MNFLYKILITTVNAFILAYLLPGIKMNDFFTAIVFAVVLAVLDAFVKPILILLTLPATILTLGLFLFVINTGMVLICDHFIVTLKVDWIWYALLFIILLFFSNSFVHKRAFAEESKTKKR